MYISLTVYCIFPLPIYIPYIYPLISFRPKVSQSSSLVDHSPVLAMLPNVKKLKSRWSKTWDLPLRQSMGRLDNNVRQLNITMLRPFLIRNSCLPPARPKTDLRNLWSPSCRSLERFEAWWKSLKQSTMAMMEPNSFSLSPLQSTHHW